MKAANPFLKNPFTTLTEPKLVDVPPPAVYKRTPYLYPATTPPGITNLSDDVSAKKPKIVYQEKRVYSDEF